MNFTSQIGQDKLVMEILNNKRNGTFIEIGCNRPIHISNSCYLEKEMGWCGIGIDIKEISEDDGQKWKDVRPNTILVIQDALTINYSELFKKYNMTTTIDFLSMDLSPADKTLECLYKIPFNEYKFRVITYETDSFRLEDGIGGAERRRISREFFKSMGYTLFKELGMKTKGANVGWNQDDVYVL